MKICPCCGTENEQNALSCQLCNFEFQTMNDSDASEKVVSSDKQIQEISSINQKETIVQQSNNAALYGVIAVLILVIIAGAIWMNQQSKNKNTISENQLSATVIPETIPETEKTAETSVNIEVTVQDVQNAAYSILSQKSAELSPLSVEYVFQDMTGDNIPELVIAWGEMTSRNYQEIYIYKNNQYQYLGEFSTGSDEVLAVPEQQLLICRTSVYGDGCLKKYTVYQIQSMSLAEKDAYAYYDGGGRPEDVYYRHNDNNITENEYNVGINSYLTLDSVKLNYEKY